MTWPAKLNYIYYSKHSMLQFDNSGVIRKSSTAFLTWPEYSRILTVVIVGEVDDRLILDTTSRGPLHACR